jgi:hypothetical protein
LPRQPPWSTNLNKTHKILTKHNFELATMVPFDHYLFMRIMGPKLVFLTNRLPAVKNGLRNGIHHQRHVPKQYEWTINIPINNCVSNLVWINFYFVI